MSGAISSSHFKFFSKNIGLNSYVSCSSIRVKLTLLYSRVILERLNRVISKNSLIKSSRCSAFSKEIDKYFSLNSSEILFAIILRFYLNEFSKYFKEINRSIDALIEENSGDIVLPSELTAIEKKINHIKHTLEQRKLAAELSEQRKNDLVVYLAHDLKTPLTSVIGYLTLLRDEKVSIYLTAFALQYYLFLLNPASSRYSGCAFRYGSLSPQMV